MNAQPTNLTARQLPKWKCLNTTTLKLLAVALMFLDHIHQMFAPLGTPVWLTMAGRLVFPIFLFTAAEAFSHTRSKRRYLLRLLFASWGMTLFTTFLQYAVPNENIVLMNNAFSTFFIAGLYMLFWDWLTEGIRNKQPKKIFKALFCCLLPILSALPMLALLLLVANGTLPPSTTRLLTALSLFIPNLFLAEGGYAMVFLGVSFYIFRKRRWLQIAALLLLSLLVYLTGGTFQCLMGLAAIPMALYNGKAGRGMKNFFYFFYPAHIGILYLIASFFM